MTIQLIQGDCLDVMKGMEAGSVDAVITDPPYGIGITKSQRLVKENGWSPSAWDESPVSQEFINKLITMSPVSVIFGANYYTMPPSRGVLVWDKQNDGRDFGEFEYAWTNLNKVARIFRMRPQNMDGGKVHPTQKPVSLMKWIILNSTKEGNTIFDPFMGSGTTGVACVNTGRNFIGIERDPEYFKIAERRIAEAQLQERMPI